ncbi:hypothetical protein BH11ACT6_BH11ACT6_34620 [soil metagenome]
MTITLPTQHILIKGDDDELPTTVVVSAVPTACEHLVITPSVSLDSDGAPVFTGGQRITHRHTGLAIAAHNETSARLQFLAEQLAQFEWNFTDPHHFKSPANTDTLTAIIEAVRTWQTQDADYGPTHFSGESESKQAARVSAPAETFLRESLETWLAQSKWLHDPEHDMINKPAEFAAWIGTSVNGYIGAYLLAVLRATDPAVADQAARSLVAALEFGDTLGEWIWQWNDELAAGKPLTLWGIPTPGAMADFERTT